MKALGEGDEGEMDPPIPAEGHEGPHTHGPPQTVSAAEKGVDDDPMELTLSEGEGDMLVSTGNPSPTEKAATGDKETTKESPKQDWGPEDFHQQLLQGERVEATQPKEKPGEERRQSSESSDTDVGDPQGILTHIHCRPFKWSQGTDEVCRTQGRRMETVVGRGEHWSSGAVHHHN